MAVPKTTQARCMDDSVQAAQRTTQVTLSLHLFCVFNSGPPDGICARP